jgi:hypothetical protein
MGNLNFGTIQENWQEYSKMYSQEMNNLIEFDEKYFMNMTNLWNEFTNNVKLGILKINGYDKENYDKFNNTLLTEFESINRSYLNLIEKQLKDETQVMNLYKPLLLNLGFGEENVNQIKEFYQLTTESYTKMWNNVMETFKKNLVNLGTSEYLDNIQKFTDNWQEIQSKIIQQMTNPSILDKWNEQYQEQNRFILKITRQMVKNYFTNYNCFIGNNANMSKTDLNESREKSEESSEELKNQKIQSTRSKKSH